MGQLRKTNQGQSLVEFLVAVGIAAAILPALLTGFIASREGKVSQDLRLRATAYLKESEEITRVVRESDWNAFAVNGTYYPKILGNTWTLTEGAETISDFTRSVTIADTDPVDQSMKLVTFSTAWGASPIETVSVTSYFTRYVGNEVLAESQTVNSSGGGFGNWCNPSESVTTVDLSRQGVPTAVWAFQSDDATGNRVFAGTGQNASGKPFTNTQITGNNPSIVATALGDFNKGGTKANSVFGSTDYAYIATDKNADAMIILDLNQFSNPPTNNLYLQVGAFNSQDPKDANSVYVVGNTAYLTTNKLYIVNVTDKANPVKLGEFGLDGTGTKVVVGNNIAYVAIAGSATKLQLVDVSNPASPGSIGKLVNANLADVRDIYINQSTNRAYLVTGASAASPEFYIVDIGNPGSPSIVTGATFETGIDPTGVAVVSGNKAIIVGTNGSDANPEYQVINIDNEGALAICTTDGTGTIRIASGIHAISPVSQTDGHAYSYIVTGDANAELKIIEGGTGGGGGGGSGTFESIPFDAGSEAAFNHFYATTDPNLTYKIAIKPGSCGGNTFSDSDFVSFGPGPLPLTTIGSGYTNPGRCLAYQAINSGPSAINFSVSFNYSP